MLIGVPTFNAVGVDARCRSPVAWAVKVKVAAVRLLASLAEAVFQFAKVSSVEPHSPTVLVDALFSTLKFDAFVAQPVALAAVL